MNHRLISETTAKAYQILVSYMDPLATNNKFITITTTGYIAFSATGELTDPRQLTISQLKQLLKYHITLSLLQHGSVILLTSESDHTLTIANPSSYHIFKDHTWKVKDRVYISLESRV